jgi:DNA polymerase III epsilon subunit-like protein
MAAQQEYNMLICLPEGKEISEGAGKVHGISKETANNFGASRTNAAHLISDLIDVADTAVAHNLDYDRRIINHMMYLESLITKVDFPNGIWGDTEMYCTMKQLKNVCKIPGRNGYKWPNLKETYRFFFNTDFKGKAHDASADSIACAEIFFAMKFLEQRHGTT